MNKAILILAFCILFSLGCARVRVEAPKEPIRVDVSMRLDIYQHIQKDIDDIENIVSGTKEKPKSKNSQSQINYFFPLAYAQDGLSPEVEQAALNRKGRLPDLGKWEEKGVLGENKFGLVEIRDKDASSPALEELVKAENNDRMVIYQAVAKKNGTSVEDVQKLYAKRLQNDASSGTPVEALNENIGSYEWKIKP